MQIDQWPAFGTSEFIAAYHLDERDLSRVLSHEGAGSGGDPLPIAATWKVAHRLAGSASMILKTADRVWVAAGSVLVEGKAGLNVGLLMPSLRNVPAVAAQGLISIGPFASKEADTLWAIAERVSRVEAGRTLVFRAGADFAMQVSRDGFVMLDGATTAQFLAQVRKTVKGGAKVSYTLSSERPAAEGEPGKATDLLAAAHAEGPMSFGLDGWSDSLAAGLDFGAVSGIVALIQHAETAKVPPGGRLTVLNGASRQLLAAGREVNVWTVTAPPSGV